MSNTENADDRKTWIAHSAAGAFSGICTRFVCQPFDVIKIRFQVYYGHMSIINILFWNICFIILSSCYICFYFFFSCKLNHCRRNRKTLSTNLFPNQFVLYSKKKVLMHCGKVLYLDSCYQ